MEQSLNSLLGEPDLLIFCGLHTYHAHKHVMCPQSSFFEQACQADSSEGQTMEIRLYDDPETVERIIAHLYGHNYEDYHDTNPFSDSTTNFKPLETLDTPTPAEPTEKKIILRFPILQVFRPRPRPTKKSFIMNHNTVTNTILTYRLARRYDIPSLLEIALSKFKTQTLETTDRKELGDVMRLIYECADGEDDREWEVELKAFVLEVIRGRIRAEIVVESLEKHGVI